MAETEKRENLSDQVYQGLLQMILQGNYQTGDRIPSELELTERFGCSRNTVRGAIKRLDALGMVESRQGGGTYIKSISTNFALNMFIPAMLVGADDLMNLMSFRRGLEVTSARLAAIRATQSDLDSMKADIDAMEEQMQNHKGYAVVTSEFHNMIAKASRNELLRTMLEIIHWIITSKMADFNEFRRDNSDSYYYHRLIYSAISNHKPEEAAYLMDRHMETLIDRVNAYNKFIGQRSDALKE